MEEIWRPVAGYEGIYEVSNRGRVRSLDRTVGSRRVKGRVMANFENHTLNRSGFKLVLMREGVRKTITVARLVAETFVSAPPNTQSVVKFRDGNWCNLRAENLYWAKRTGRIATRPPRAKLALVPAPRPPRINDLTGEEWLPVLGYEGRYEVSSFGRIRSLPRLVKTKGGVRRIPGRTMSLNTCHTLGAPGVCLSYEGKRRTHMVGRLVADAFLPKPRGITWPEVYWRDGDRGNCKVKNLKWVPRGTGVIEGIRRAKVAA